MADRVRRAIPELLQADAALVAMLGSTDKIPKVEHIFHRTAPQDAEFPCVIFSKQSGTPEYTFGDLHENELWTIKGVDRAGVATIAEDIDERIRAVLQDAELPVDGWTTLYFRREQDVDYGEREDGALIHHCGAMYRLLRQETP